MRCGAPPRPRGPGNTASRPAPAAHGARPPAARRAAVAARGSAGAGRQQRRFPPAAASRWRGPAPRPASGGSAAELERGRRRGGSSWPRCCRRRVDGRTRGLGAAQRSRRGAAGLTGPDEAEGEAASAGGGAGAGGPGSSAQRGALGAVPREAARQHPRGIRSGGATGGRTGESLRSRGAGNTLSEFTSSLWLRPIPFPACLFTVSRRLFCSSHFFGWGS